MPKSERQIVEENKALKRKLEALKAETKYSRVEDIKIEFNESPVVTTTQKTPVKNVDLENEEKILIPLVIKDLRKTVILGSAMILIIAGLKIATMVGVNIPYLG